MFRMLMFLWAYKGSFLYALLINPLLDLICAALRFATLADDDSVESNEIK